MMNRILLSMAVCLPLLALAGDWVNIRTQERGRPLQIDGVHNPDRDTLLAADWRWLDGADMAPEVAEGQQRVREEYLQHPDHADRAVVDWLDQAVTNQPARQVVVGDLEIVGSNSVIRYTLEPGGLQYAARPDPETGEWLVVQSAHSPEVSAEELAAAFERAKQSNDVRRVQVRTAVSRCEQALVELDSARDQLGQARDGLRSSRAAFRNLTLGANSWAALRAYLDSECTIQTNLVEAVGAGLQATQDTVQSTRATTKALRDALERIR
jgi:hypothetical protein